MSIPPIHFTLKRGLFFAAGASAGLLGVAFIAQYAFGLHPCELCMAQRYPYALIIAIALVAGLSLRSMRAQWAALSVCMILFWVDAGIAAYHAGVEQGIFTGPTACTGSGATGQTLEEMRAEIMNATLVPCNQAQAHVLGLSMAAWNAIAASLLGIFTSIIIWRNRPNHAT